MVQCYVDSAENILGYGVGSIVVSAADFKKFNLMVRKSSSVVCKEKEGNFYTPTGVILKFEDLSDTKLLYKVVTDSDILSGDYILDLSSKDKAYFINELKLSSDYWRENENEDLKLILANDGKITGLIHYKKLSDNCLKVYMLEIKPKNRGYGRYVIKLLFEQDNIQQICGISTKKAFNFWKAIGCSFDDNYNFKLNKLEVSL